MLILVHIIISFLIGIMLYPFFGVYSIIFFFAGFLIDFDHYAEYVFREKDLNIFKAYKYFRKHGFSIGDDKNIKEISKKYRLHLNIFHTFEFLILLLIFSFFNKVILFIFLGFLIHVLTDLFEFLVLRSIYKNFPGPGRYYFITLFLLDKYKK
jgi:hypothetical protein